MAKTRDELKETLEAVVGVFMSEENAPCTERREDAGGLPSRSCLQREEARTRKSRAPGYQNYKPDNMCQHCATAWHLDCARLIFCFALHSGPMSESGS